MKKILIINGPNLNLLGKREPHLYGTVSFEEYLVTLKESFPEAELDYYQSNLMAIIIPPEEIKAPGTAAQRVSTIA